MNNIPVIFTKNSVLEIGYRVKGLVFNDERFKNGAEIQTSMVVNIIILNGDPDRYSAMIVTNTGSRYIVYAKALTE